MAVDQAERARAIGLRIVAARKRKGLSQVGLAEALAERAGNVVESESVRRSLGNNERGKYAPRLRTLEAIAEITDQPISFFLGPAEVGPAPDPFRHAE